MCLLWKSFFCGISQDSWCDLLYISFWALSRFLSWLCKYLWEERTDSLEAWKAIDDAWTNFKDQTAFTKQSRLKAREGQLAIRMVRTWWRKKTRGLETNLSCWTPNCFACYVGRRWMDWQTGLGRPASMICWWPWTRICQFLRFPMTFRSTRPPRKCMKMRGASYGVSRRPVTIYNLSAQTNFESVKPSISYEGYDTYILLHTTVLQYTTNTLYILQCTTMYIYDIYIYVWYDMITSISNLHSQNILKIS